MIPRISKGASAYGALAYDHGPGRRDEHTNPHKVAGNVPGRTWRERAKAIDQHARTARSDITKPLHRTSLRISESDRALTDREWKQVATEYVTRMGFDKCPWEATRHADDHIHITVNRVQWDGKIARTSHDYARAQAASRHIERRHGLEDASLKYVRARPQISKGEKESAARRQVKPEREQLREKLTAAERASDGTRASYEKALTDHGVEHRANVSKTTGRVSGYSYGLAGHTASPKGAMDKPKAQVWFKGSQLGRDYSWQKTSERLSGRSRAGHQNVGERAGDLGRGRPNSPAKFAGNEQRQPALPGRRQQLPTAPMTREDARAEAARRAAQRKAAIPVAEMDRIKTPTQGKNVVQQADSTQPMTREQAKAEAQRRAAERQREQQHRDQERGRER